jgi:hypothetical protein
MGELIVEKLDSPWTLAVVENAGEIDAAQIKEEIKVKTAPLLTDIKAQLMLVPRTLTYTVGWRALVWQNKETNQFQDLTEEEFAAYVDGGIVSYTRGANENNDGDETPEGNAGDNPL